MVAVNVQITAALLLPQLIFFWKITLVDLIKIPSNRQTYDAKEASKILDPTASNM